MIDCVGNEIHEGAILKVFHFYGHRNRKHFMYKQAGTVTEKGYLIVYHLPINDGSYLASAQDLAKDYVVVSCNCEEHIRKDLKISKNLK